MKKTKICNLLNIQYPIIQAGMVWVSGGKLAAASANAGCLGVIGAGSMSPTLLEEHILKAQRLTDKSLAVNLPLLYSKIEEQINVALKCGIKIFITSAGSPKKFTKMLKDKGCIVIHVCSTPVLAKKCEEAGVDAVIVEGFEAGGHNGRDELTSLVLLPQCVKAVNIPVIIAGGFATGDSVVSALALGAEGVQMGTRFMMTQESSAHDKYKNLLVNSSYNCTDLVMKNLVPVRLVKNKFYQDVKSLEESCAENDEVKKLLGKGRAKLGMLEGDLDEGELESGQVCSNIEDIPSVKSLVSQIIKEYHIAVNRFIE